MQKRVLILTSKVGSGHISIAEAYKQIIKNNSPTSEVFVLNTSPDAVSWAYRFITSYFGKIYLKIWTYSNNENISKILHSVHILVTRNKLLNVLKSFRPDLIISTNAYSASPTYIGLKSLGLKTPIIVVIADPFSIHKTWLTFRKADLYLAPTDEAKKDFIKNGIPGTKINITGWPVRKSFYRSVKNKSSYKKSILLTSGGEGLSYIRTYLLEALKDSEIRLKYKFSVVCARNTELYLSVQMIQKMYPDSVNVYKFVKNIHELMAKADLIVGKPGPNFLYEAITLGKPFVAIGIPIGQEAGNYDFITKNKIGTYAKDPKDFKNYLLSREKIEKSGINTQKLIEFTNLQKRTPRKIWNSLKPYLE